MIEAAFKLCQDCQKNDKILINALKSDPQLKVVLKSYYETIKKQNEDVIILFNWFIGTNFHICVNELKNAN